MIQPMATRSAGLTPLALAALQAGGILLAWYGSILPALASHANRQSIAALNRSGCGAMLENAHRVAAMATPWPEDQLKVISEALSEIAKQDKLQACPQWRELYDLAKQRVSATYAGQPEHFRLAGNIPALARMLALRSGDPELIKEAQRHYEALIAGSPQRQLYRYRFAEMLASTGRVEEARDQLVQAFAADPKIGESLWQLGVFRWQHENQAEIGSQMIGQAADGICRHPLSSSAEAILLAHAFSVQGDRSGLRSMEQRISALPAEDQPASSYLDIARLQEQAGLGAERDRMLRIAAARDATIGARLAPLLDGRVRTIAESERLAMLAATNP
jgi:tetratricopeptide (TPR) repeat protein